MNCSGYRSWRLWLPTFCFKLTVQHVIGSEVCVCLSVRWYFWIVCVAFLSIFAVLLFLQWFLTSPMQSKNGWNVSLRYLWTETSSLTFVWLRYVTRLLETRKDIISVSMCVFLSFPSVCSWVGQSEILKECRSLRPFGSFNLKLAYRTFAIFTSALFRRWFGREGCCPQ